MNQVTKHKLLLGCLTALVAISTTLTPISANAATTNSPGSMTRIGGVDRFETAALMAQKGWPGTSDHVVLSAGMNDNLVDALAAGPLATKLNAPILLTDGGQSINSFAKAELQRLKPQKVYITSGPGVIKPSVLAELVAMGITPVQLGGSDRYETSVNIAKELERQGADITRIVLAGAWATPVDALSVSSIAAAQGMPILATRKDQLPPSVKAYLDTIKDQVTDSYVIGSTGVVSNLVKAALPGTASRYDGPNRYDTNVQVLKKFAKEYKNDKVYVANGVSMVDAVAGVPLAAADRAAVVLVNQPIDNATRDFVKSTMSTNDMVVLGSEGAISAAGINALTSVLSYATDGATVGSADPTKPLKLMDNVKLTGNDVTLKNAILKYSVYIKGNNATLSNLTVQGTVFVDPGESGTATLDGVSAEKIVILSGASDSIHLKNTTTGNLTVDSSSNVRVQATGSTSIGNTVVRSFAILDAAGGSLGQVLISSALGQNPVVELRGTFTQPVVVEGAATLQAAAGATISVQISQKTKDQSVTLEGTFKTLELNHGARAHLGASAVIADLITNGNAYLRVDLGAKVTKYDNKGNTVDITGSGAHQIPTSSTIPPTVPGGPADPTVPVAPISVTIKDLQIMTDPAGLSAKVNNGATIDLSKLDELVKVKGFGVTADRNCTLEFDLQGKNQTIDLVAGQQTVVTIGDLIFDGQITGGINLREFRLFYTTKTLKGDLIIDGKKVGALSVTIKF